MPVVSYQQPKFPAVYRYVFSRNASFFPHNALGILPTLTLSLESKVTASGQGFLGVALWDTVVLSSLFAELDTTCAAE
jgi:hypothetical protein